MNGAGHTIDLVIIESGYTPQDPIEFHFYAGEEGGLLGSQDIVSNYSARTDPPVRIKGMLQMDMTVSFLYDCC